MGGLAGNAVQACDYAGSVPGAGFAASGRNRILDDGPSPSTIPEDAVKLRAQHGH